MDYRITITAGTEKDADGFYLTEDELQRAVDAIRRTLIMSFERYSETATFDAWVDDDGWISRERGLRWTCLAAGVDRTEAERRGLAAAERVAAELRRARVMLEVEPVTAAFVGPVRWPRRPRWGVVA